jgi:xanthine dehydrogenase iron-sulfur cluster and FAD-binding subunit A
MNIDDRRRDPWGRRVLHLGARQRWFRCFRRWELWDRIGGEQVRNMGTVGGNIANGSPIGDTPPP